jgi:hypothetical protein
MPKGSPRRALAPVPSSGSARVPEAPRVRPSNAPSPEYRAHHRIIEPAIDSRVVRPYWSKRSRLMVLLEEGDPPGVARRATAQDRHAGGDERHSVFAAQRWPLPSGGLPGRRSPTHQTAVCIARWRRSANRIVKGPSPERAATARMRRKRPFGRPVASGSRRPLADRP